MENPCFYFYSDSVLGTTLQFSLVSGHITEGVLVLIRPTAAMTDIIKKIMVEILCILAIATKDIKQRRASELIPDVAI